MKKRDPIITLLKIIEENMPETVYLMRNKERYEEVVKAMEEIKDFILSIEDDAKFKVEKDELLGTTLILEVNCTLLSFTEVDEFCEAIKKVDTIDVVAKTDGTLGITFGFNDAYVPCPPSAK